jgi:hypothetical protein
MVKDGVWHGMDQSIGVWRVDTWNVGALHLHNCTDGTRPEILI